MGNLQKSQDMGPSSFSLSNRSWELEIFLLFVSFLCGVSAVSTFVFDVSILQPFLALA
jgi:hypothetical protein